MSLTEDIHRAVVDYPGLTAVELAEEIGCAPSRVSPLLLGLVKRKEIERSGEGGHKDPFRYFDAGDSIKGEYADGTYFEPSGDTGELPARAPWERLRMPAPGASIGVSMGEVTVAYGRTHLKRWREDSREVGVRLVDSKTKIEHIECSDSRIEVNYRIALEEIELKLARHFDEEEQAEIEEEAAKSRIVQTREGAPRVVSEAARSPRSHRSAGVRFGERRDLLEYDVTLVGSRQEVDHMCALLRAYKRGGMAGVRELAGAASREDTA